MPIYPSKDKQGKPIPGKHRVTIYANGRQLEWTVEGSKREAKNFEAQKRIEVGAEKLSTRASPSFHDFSQKVYGPHAAEHLRDSTWERVRVYQIASLARFFGKMKLTAITVEAVERYKIERVREIAHSTVNAELRVLGTMLRYAAHLGYPAALPKWKRLPQRGAGRARAWTLAELARLFTAAQEHAPDIFPLLFFLANTGCRKGEGMACEWSWINLRRGLVEIPVSEVWRPKSNKPREVPIPAALRPLLTGPRRHERWVFPTTLGDRYTVFPEGLWRRARDAAGLTGGPHQLRHTYASHFLSKLPDLPLLGAILGHSTQRITELYAHLLPGHLERARDVVSFDFSVGSGSDSGLVKE